MKLSKKALVALAMGISTLNISPDAFAQQPTSVSQNPQTSSTNTHKHFPYYNLLRRSIADANPEEYVWDIERAKSTPPQSDDNPDPPREVFRMLTADDLKLWINSLPEDSVIMFWYNMPGSIHHHTAMETPAAIQHQLGLDDFTHYCESRKVHFLFVGTYR